MRAELRPPARLPAGVSLNTLLLSLECFTRYPARAAWTIGAARVFVSFAEWCGGRLVAAPLLLFIFR